MTHALPWLWYPLFLLAAIAGFSGLLAADVHVLVALYSTIVMAGVAVVVLELLAPERLDWRPSRSDVINDCIYMLVAQILTPRVLAMLAAVSIAGAMHEAPVWLWPHQWPVAVQVLLMVLAVDLMRYWLHRACHTFTPLWRLHEVHHSPDILYTLNTARFHPFEKVLHFSLDSVPFLLLGVAPEVIAAYFLLYSVNGFFQHCNARLRYGWLNYVVASAETHRWHHARNPKTASCNFSNTTIVWDLLFGTWYLPKNEALDVGIENRHYPKTFRAQMLSPFMQAREDDHRFNAGVGARMKSRLINVAIGVSLTLTDCLHRLQLRFALRDPMRSQRAVLARILHANRHTTFGLQHGFASIANANDSESDFRKRVSVQQFEDLRPFINAEIASGESALTQQAPIAYLRTSGTTGQAKDIPLTATHLRQLRRCQRRAVAAQYRRCAAAFRGRILAIASASVEGYLDNGRPYGSASGIVAGSSPSLVREKFVLPQQLAKIEEVATRYLLIVRLAIAKRDITYLGTANPSTLLALVRLYREHEAEFINDVRHGGFFARDRVPDEVWQAIRPRLAADPMRAEELQRLCQQADNEGHQQAVQIGQLWPDLRLVVTWTCASAGVALGALRTQLSKHTKVHELGYLSSEFMGTITIGKQPGSGLLTYDTHFFEFVERDLWDSGTPRFLTLDQLRKGHDYYVLVTTPSGLYRYFINDLIRVTGVVHRMPLVKFLQKGKGVTNITGEKLYETQVLDAVHRVMAAMGLTARFVMAQADESVRQYRLYFEARSVADDIAVSIDAQRLAAQVDAQLCRLNIEYGSKRESARLQPLVAFALRENTEVQFRAACVAQGQREGQFKSVALDYRSQAKFDFDACVTPALVKAPASAQIPAMDDSSP